MNKAIVKIHEMLASPKNRKYLHSRYRYIIMFQMLVSYSLEFLKSVLLELSLQASHLATFYPQYGVYHWNEI